MMRGTRFLVFLVLILGFAGRAIAVSDNARTARLTGQALTVIGTTASGETDKDGSDRRLYIIQLEEPPLASYRGGIDELAPTREHFARQSVLEAEPPAVSAYREHLSRRRRAILDSASALLDRRVTQERSFDVSFNGCAIRLASEEARRVREIPGVAGVYRNLHRSIHTDSGPQFIGAAGIWDGSSTGGNPTRGEGVIVGILDTGINPAHPSFADIGDDGYDHTNPYGTGNYKGVCDSSNPAYDPSFPCNDKLIGAWNFNGEGPRDDDGHGSHTASTAAGNVLQSIDYTAPTASFSFDISGVAPHANIIAYDVCKDGCASTDSVAALDQAILDGVDVINYSIGGGGEPYDDAVSIAFLGARDAGIVVCAAAGNEGPAEESVEHREPWTMTVGASTHDRALHSVLINMSGGDTAAPADISGKSVTTGLGTAPIVYAGDYGDPLCQNPFAGGTFSGEIVVCDRGVVARIDKGANVLAGGAGGLVLANDDDNNESLNADGHVLPAVHITYADGLTLKQWLASGSGHTAAIAGTTIKSDPANGDVMASFSSRGPSFGIDTLKPDLTAPGVDIIAAGDGNAGADPSELEVMAGTSMATPHATGAAALLTALHPTWTPGQIQSALITTAAHSAMVTNDGITPADPFDMGAGRVNLDSAGLAPLVIDESKTNFDAADPTLGGDPRTLNVPSMTSSLCHGSCSFTRSVTNVSGGALSFTASVEFEDPGFVITVSPDTLNLAAGASASFDVSIDTTRVELDAWHFGALTWEESTGSLPDTRIPIAIATTSSSRAAMLSKKVNSDSANPGDTLTYILTATNGGYTSESFTLNDPLPANTTYVGGSATGGLAYDGPSDSVGWTGTLAPRSISIDPATSPFGYVSLAGLGFEPYDCFDTGCDEFAIIVGLESFHFWHAGERYNTVSVVTNGYIFPGIIEAEDIDYQNQNFPDATRPNNVIAPLWTDFDLDDPGITDDGQGTWYGAIIEDGSTRYLVIEWEHAQVYGSPGNLCTVQLWIQEDTANMWFVYEELPATLPPATVGVEDANGTAGAVAYFNGSGTAPVVGTDLLVGTTEGESRVFSFQATIDADSNEPIFNEASLSWGGQSSSAWITTALPSSMNADLNMTLTADSTQSFSAAFSYSLTAANTGPISATNVIVADTMPVGLSYVSDTCGGQLIGETWQWEVGAIGSGLSRDCELTVVPTTLGTIVNTATISGSQNDPATSDNSDQASVEVSPPAGLIFMDGFENNSYSNWSGSNP